MDLMIPRHHPCVQMDSGMSILWATHVIRAANGSRFRYISIWKMDPNRRSRSTRYTFEIQIQWIHLQPYLWYIFIEWQQHPLGLLQVRADRHNPTIKVIPMRHWTNPATHVNLNGCISLTSTYDSLQKLDFLFAIWLASWPWKKKPDNTIGPRDVAFPGRHWEMFWHELQNYAKHFTRFSLHLTCSSRMETSETFWGIQSDR